MDTLAVILVIIGASSLLAALIGCGIAWRKAVEAERLAEFVKDRPSESLLDQKWWDDDRS